MGDRIVEFKKPRVPKEFLVDFEYPEIFDISHGVNTPALITGYPRSGLFYLYEWMNLAMTDVGWHRVGLHGTISWQAIAPGFMNSERIIHIVRNPLDVISSAYFNLSSHYIEFLKHYSSGTCNGIKDNLRIIIRTYAYWNKLCQTRTKKLYKIEDIKSGIFGIFKDMGLKPGDHPIDANRHHVKQIKTIYQRFDWHDIISEDERYGEEVKRMSEKWGYPEE